MRPKRFDFDPDNTDDNSVCLAQAVASAKALTLNGAYVSGGVATMDYARRLDQITAGNDAGITFTYVGTDAGMNNLGTGSVLIGYQAGYENTGTTQTAFGYLAGKNNTGNSQTALGYDAGSSNTGGSQTVLGFWVRESNALYYCC